MITIEPYAPSIQTYKERPSQEATKATSLINKFMYWITNQSSQERFRDAFGPVLGDHFWNKLQEKRERQGPLAGDLGIWLEMTDCHRDELMHYIIKTKYKCQ